MVLSIGALSDDQLANGMTEAQAIKEGIIIRDTIKVGAWDNVFTKDFPVDELRYVPFTKKKYQFRMGAGTVITETGLEVPVFEARVSNTEIFEDLKEQYEEQILEENGERKRLKKYPGLKVGDLNEANNNVGNWE